jgi:release factor glutamine methyltransferase
MDQTVLTALAWAKGLLKAQSMESPGLEAELLLGHVLKLSRIELIIHRQRPVTGSEMDTFRALLERRIKREPIAYIVGEKEFFGRPFRVTPQVLIPRPETEAMVEYAVAAAPKGSRVLEIGVGSGAVIVSLLCERPDLEGYGNDISFDAIRVARDNARFHGVKDRLRLYTGDGLKGVHATFPLILANPPYVALSEQGRLEDDVRLFEPPTALFGGKDGLDIVKEIIEDASGCLSSEGLLIMEVGQGQRDAAEDMVSGQGRLRVRQWMKDLAGIPRTAVMERIYG